MDFSQWPVLVTEHLQSQWQRLEEALSSHPEIQQQLAELSSEQQQPFKQTLLSSDYVLDQWARFPPLLARQLAGDDLQRRYSPGEMRALLKQALRAVEKAEQLDKALRDFRREQMIRLIWRDCNQLADFVETTRDLSELADACVAETIAYHYQWLTPTWGTPFYKDSDRPMPMIVLGMGKLGANELNLSSDIDLMFAFAHEGETQGGSRSLGHRDFFIRLGQRVIKSLDAINADGFVFRVDMRLRPYGSAGALALSHDAMLTYYEEQGREWERYAMIKARSMADDNGDGEKLLQQLRPFVYRRYIDFGVIESLREMKALINREVLRKGADTNVKTGSGGIREVEFVAQAVQLIRGGQEPALQERSLLKVMQHIKEMELLPAQAVDELLAAYVFLRNVEHRIQAQADRQTQSLPDNELAQLRLALSLGFANWQSFIDVLNEQRQKVREHFENVIAPAEQDQQNAQQNESAQSLWLDELPAEECNSILEKLGFSADHWDQVGRLISDLRESKTVLHLRAIPRERLDKLMPLVLAACGQQASGHIALERVMPLIQAILRRSAYMSLLMENVPALDRLATLCVASPWVAELMARYPVLLDELIDPNSLFSPPPLTELRDELRQFMLRVPEDDFEQQMECLRQFRNAHLLRVAASEINGTLPLMQVSDYLTWIAETILQQVLDLAWKQLVEKHGSPTNADGEPCGQSFIIVAYGKMGGIELSYSSDLDLVFIHGAAGNQSTDGERSIDNNVFFSRLGQRIIHILSTRTASGLLYETDMRLRPSGNSGMLVASLQAFEHYQMDKAWTWEKQALVRARVVAGSDKLTAEFSDVRSKVLAQPRDGDVLMQEIIEMRHKMMDHLSLSKQRYLTPALFAEDKRYSIKQDPGGIVDIEFLTQYLVLRHAHEHPGLLAWSDNVRLLESLQAVGLLTVADADTLTQAYLGYRARTHRLALHNEPAQLPGNEFVAERKAVREIWHKVISADSETVL